MKKDFLSIVIPLYNEEESLPELYKELKKVLSKYKYEIIFIDDGSTDNSFNILLKLKKNDKNIKIIKFKRNYGKSYALEAGFRNVTGDYIITMDADLQDNPFEIDNLVKAIKSNEYDAISGWKYRRYDPLSKVIASRFFNFIVRIFTGIKLHDMNCGLKIYKKDTIKDLHLYGSMHRYIPVLLKFDGYKFGEIKVKHRARKYGKSKFGNKRFLAGLLDFFTVLFLMKFMEKPLHLFGTIGLFFDLVGGVILGYITYLRIIYHTINNRLPLLNGGILLIMIGFQFISIGLLGELMVGRNFRKKRYVIEKYIK